MILCSYRSPLLAAKEKNGISYEFDVHAWISKPDTKARETSRARSQTRALTHGESEARGSVHSEYGTIMYINYTAPPGCCKEVSVFLVCEIPP